MKLRPVFYPHHDCLRHWSEILCMGCLYDDPEYRHIGNYWRWRIAQPLRALYCRLFARFEYDGPTVPSEGEQL